MTAPAPAASYVPYVEHPGYATVGEIMALFDLPQAEVYRLANEHHWRRYTLDSRVRYHRDDVDDTLGKPA